MNLCDGWSCPDDCLPAFRRSRELTYSKLSIYWQHCAWVLPKFSNLFDEHNRTFNIWQIRQLLPNLANFWQNLADFAAIRRTRELSYFGLFSLLGHSRLEGEGAKKVVGGFKNTVTVPLNKARNIETLRATSYIRRILEKKWRLQKTILNFIHHHTITSISMSRGVSAWWVLESLSKKQIEAWSLSWSLHDPNYAKLIVRTLNATGNLGLLSLKIISTFNCVDTITGERWSRRTDSLVIARKIQVY